jgi:hypothetical protein
MFIPIVELSQNRKILEVKVIWISTLWLIFSYSIYFKKFLYDKCLENYTRRNTLMSLPKLLNISFDFNQSFYVSINYT